MWRDQEPNGLAGRHTRSLAKSRKKGVRGAPGGLWRNYRIERDHCRNPNRQDHEVRLRRTGIAPRLAALGSKPQRRALTGVVGSKQAAEGPLGPLQGAAEALQRDRIKRIQPQN